MALRVTVGLGIEYAIREPLGFGDDRARGALVQAE
jgi:hypothetical protein